MVDETYFVFSKVVDDQLGNQAEYHTLIEARDYAQQHHAAMMKLRPEHANELYTLISYEDGEVYMCFYLNEIRLGDEARYFADWMAGCGQD